MSKTTRNVTLFSARDVTVSSVRGCLAMADEAGDVELCRKLRELVDWLLPTAGQDAQDGE